MVETLREQGVELMISPYFHMVTNISRNFADALARGLLVRNGTDPELGPARDQEFSGPKGLLHDGDVDAFIYDVFTAESREYAWQKVAEGYVKPYGIKHWWLDCDEPCGLAKGDILVYNNGHWPASFVGAAYPHMLARMVYEGMGKSDLADDNVMLGRSAWAGSQRFGAAVWSGDTRSNFTSLQLQFKAGLNLVMSGLPYWTTDIGGYNMYDTYEGGIENPRFRQLLVRWFQWGAFCPLFRLHGGRQGGPSQEGGNKACGATNSANEVWMFGEEAEAAISRVMRIREQLRPYIMEQYAEAAASGTPIMRPLFVDFYHDPASQAIDTQMMFGPDFLVAPQLEENATNRTVYLPPLPSNQTWRNFFSGVRTQPRAGGQWIVEQTPTHGEGLGTFPVYQRVAVKSDDGAVAVAVVKPPPPPPVPQVGPWLSQPFVAGVGGYADYRIPALVATPTADGGSILLAFCEGRKYSSADMDWNDIVLRRSSDGGLTWGALQLVHGESSSKHHVTIGNPSPVVVASQPGRVVLTGTRQTSEGFRVVSEDFGKTWGEAVYQPHLNARQQHGSGAPKPAYGQPASNWTFYMPGPASGIQLPSGRL